jgi:hypothetical protein
MLLIPDLKEKDNNNGPNSTSDNSLFKIFPEKTVLNTRISLDSIGYNILASDSINLIYYSGNVKDIEFDFQIENKVLNQVININSESNIWNYFKYRNVPELRAVYFIWKPPIIDRRSYVYNVKVSASAVVDIFDKSLKKNVLRKFNSKTQFSLVVSYFDKQTGLPFLASQKDTNTSTNFSTIPTGGTINTGEIFFDFESKKINALTTEEWTNKINLWGINLNSELASKPELKVMNSPDNNLGTAYVKQISNNSIILAGRPPHFGNSRIKIKLVRKSDKSSSEDEFLVYPIPLLEPSFPSIVYPQQNYKIEPNLPEINEKSFLVRIQADNKILYSSTNTNSFSFSADDNQIGKTLYLERFINGVQYGKSYPINVKQFPAPQIVRIQNIGSKKTRIIINSFGFVDGSENFIKNIDIIGNAVYSEIIGQSSFNRSNLMFTQVYEVKAKIDGAPFEFKIKAQDQRGNWSTTESYP